MTRILVIFGTRPEAIKLAPVIRMLKTRAVGFDIRVCVTGQHREMLDQVLRFFEITPDFDLNLMRPKQTLNGLAAALVAGLDEVIRTVDPELVCVQGDTTSTMIGALAAYHLGAKIAHVEAGLRSGRNDSPFPEEVNRKIVGQIADFHFAPTAAARENLRREGIQNGVWVTGNTAIDALHLGLDRLQQGKIELSPDLDSVDVARQIVLVTVHRRESFGLPFQRIVDAIRLLAGRFPETQVVFPVHLNPQVREIVYGQLKNLSNVLLMDPVNYPSLIWLMKSCHLILTDSGGIQEEAPALGKPVLVLRDVTERMEGVEAGTAELVGSDTQKIIAAAGRLLTDEHAYGRMSQAVNPYGDGHAAEQIVDVLGKHFSSQG